MILKIDIVVWKNHSLYIEEELIIWHNSIFYGTRKRRQSGFFIFFQGFFSTLSKTQGKCYTHWMSANRGFFPNKISPVPQKKLLKVLYNRLGEFFIGLSTERLFNDVEKVCISRKLVQEWILMRWKKRENIVTKHLFIKAKGDL